MVKNTREIFMEKNLYRDELNSAAEPTQIEKDFAKLEREAADIIKQITDNDSVIITKEQEELLKLFLALMGMRSKRTKDTLIVTGDNVELWKRNLKYLVNCRSLKDVINNQAIDDKVKDFVRRDTEYLFGTYFVIAERRGKEDFVLGDAFPTDLIGETDSGKEGGLIIYSMIPLSPKRILLQVPYGAEATPESVSGFSKSFLRNSYIVFDNTINIPIKKVYEPNVKRINGQILKESIYGCVIKDLSRVSFVDD